MKVTFLTNVVHRYRVPFHERVSICLQKCGATYIVATGEPPATAQNKSDTCLPLNSVYVSNTYFRVLSVDLVWQHIPKKALDCDLLVMSQENRQLANYLLQIRPWSWRPRLAFFGHGRNFQTTNPNSMAEQWKRFWATKVDWWFAYTDESKHHIASLGFPPERITVFNNAVDTTELARLAAAVSSEKLAARRTELRLAGTNTAIFVGGLYPDKRLDFLFAAADRVRTCVPDFELIIVGGGIDLPKAKAAATSRPWAKIVGPRFGADKVELMALAKLFLMPGLVGLAVLDAGVLGLPLVTTDYPYHSPEIAYLEDGVTGLIVKPWTSVENYASAIIDLLADPSRIAMMARAAHRTAGNYSIESMAERFATGILQALEAPWRQGHLGGPTSRRQ